MIARGMASLVTSQCSFKPRQSHVRGFTFELTGKIGIAKTFGSHLQAMSLIPSESYSFPDHFTRTVVPSLKPKKQEPEPAPLETRRKRPAIVPLPSPQVQPAPVVRRENFEPVRSKPPGPAPNPALRRVSAPPPRIPEAPVRKMPLPPILTPKVRWNMRARAMDPASNAGNGTEQIPHAAPMALAQNVIPMKPARVAHPPRMMPPPGADIVQHTIPKPPAKPVAPVKPVHAQSVSETPRPAAVSDPQADFFETFAQTGERALSKRRRKTKMRRFIVCESAALAILLPLVILGLARHPDNVALVWIMNISTITSAVAAALLPILFFAFTPTLPEIER